MASNIIFLCTLLCFLLLFSHTISHQPILKPEPDRLTRVKQALWAADHYKIMSLIVAKKLQNLPEECHNHISPLTIFVPRDDAIRIDPYVNLDYQIVAQKVERGDFAAGNLQKDSNLKTCYQESNVTVTQSSIDDDQEDVRASINMVVVMDWDIYKDGNLTIHGVEDFFDVRWTIKEDYFCLDLSMSEEEAMTPSNNQPQELVKFICPLDPRAMAEEHSETLLEHRRFRRSMNSYLFKYPKY